MKNISIASMFLTVAASGSFCPALTVNFEELPATPSGYYNGGPVTNSAGWTSQGTFFNNSYNSNYGGYWSGWSYSRVNNPTTGDYTNQYAAITGAGSGGSDTYAVAYTPAYINLPAGYAATSIDLTNTTYTYFTLLNGNEFSRAFTTGDYFTVTLTGYTGVGGTGASTGSATFTLADYRVAHPYVVNTWETLGLGGLGNAASIGLSFFSTDSGAFGINTPTYVAADNLVLTAVPEPVVGMVLPMFILVGQRRRNSTR